MREYEFFMILPYTVLQVFLHYRVNNRYALNLPAPHRFCFIARRRVPLAGIYIIVCRQLCEYKILRARKYQWMEKEFTEF